MNMSSFLRFVEIGGIGGLKYLVGGRRKSSELGFGNICGKSKNVSIWLAKNCGENQLTMTHGYKHREFIV